MRTLAAIGHPAGGEVVRRTALYQIYFTGVDAVLVVVSLGLIIGGVVVVQALSILSGTGNEDFLGTLMELVIFREVGPLMAALIVIGRSGSSITVELGNMAVHRELDLLEAMGIDPYRLLVLPRLIGVVAATFCLCMLFDTVAVFGGFGVARLATEISVWQYARIVGWHLTFVDIGLGAVKTVTFGTVIATVSTWQGMAVGRAITEVPQATRRSVIHSLVLCFVVDLLVTVAFYGVWG